MYCLAEPNLIRYKIFLCINPLWCQFNAPTLPCSKMPKPWGHTHDSYLPFYIDCENISYIFSTVDIFSLRFVDIVSEVRYISISGHIRSLQLDHTYIRIIYYLWNIFITYSLTANIFSFHLRHINILDISLSVVCMRALSKSIQCLCTREVQGVCTPWN